MAGKRPDQYRIDPAEGRATDHKNLPQSGQGNANFDDTVSGDHQRLSQSRAKMKENQPFLPDVPSPSAEANRAARRDRGEDQDTTDHSERSTDE